MPQLWHRLGRIVPKSRQITATQVHNLKLDLILVLHLVLIRYRQHRFGPPRNSAPRIDHRRCHFRVLGLATRPPTATPATPTPTPTITTFASG